MNVKSAKFYFSDKTIETEIIKDSYTSTEILHNNLQGADGTCSFKVPFSIELSNQIQSEIGGSKIKVEIKGTDGKNINTYYIKDSVTIEKTQKGQPISISAICPSFFLDVDLPRNIVIIDKTVGEIITKVLNEIEFTDYSSIYIPTKISYFEANEGDSAKSIINELLYEYGYVTYFDADGLFRVRNLFDNLPENTDDISQTLDGTNLREKVTIKAKEKEADYVSATYSKLEYFQNTLIFSDTQNADDDNQCVIEIEPGYYLFESSEEKESSKRSKKINYLDYDSTLGEVRYASEIYPDVIFPSKLEYELTRFDEKGNDLIDQASLWAYNPTSEILKITKLDIYGNAYISTASETVVSSTGTKAKEIELDYVYDRSKAEEFAVNLANYYRWCNFEITAKSYDDYELGSYVKVTDYGIGTYYGRIIQKKRTLKNNCIEYQIETITDYTPAEIDKTTSNRKGTNAAGAVRGEKGATGEKGEPMYSAGLYCYIEQENYTFEIDDLGQVEEDETYIPIYVMADNLQLPYTLGTIEQPKGLTIVPYYNDDGQTLGIYVKSTIDYKLQNGSVKIPIVFNEIEGAYVYGDGSKKYGFGNGSEAYGYYDFVDGSTYDYTVTFSWDTGYYGIYRGAKSSVDGFLSPDTNTAFHRGDWFTWNGTEEATATYNGVEVTFKPTGVYRWNNHGYWEEDDNWTHLVAATSDVVSVNKSMQETNSKKLDELLKNLANNSYYLDYLNNSALPELMAKNDELQTELSTNADYIKKLTGITYNPETGTYYDNKINTVFTNSLATNSVYTDKLVANEAFVNSLVSEQILSKWITADTGYFNTLVANNGFFNSLIAASVATETITAAQGWFKTIAADTAFLNKLIVEKIVADEIYAVSIKATNDLYAGKIHGKYDVTTDSDGKSTATENSNNVQITADVGTVSSETGYSGPANFWNLDTGEFRIGNSKAENLESATYVRYDPSANDGLGGLYAQFATLIIKSIGNVVIGCLFVKKNGDVDNDSLLVVNPNSSAETTTGAPAKTVLVKGDICVYGKSYGDTDNKNYVLSKLTSDDFDEIFSIA